MAAFKSTARLDQMLEYARELAGTDKLGWNQPTASFMHIADALEQLKPDERKEVMARVHKLYCKDCWYPLKENKTCHCENDD